MQIVSLQAAMPENIANGHHDGDMLCTNMRQGVMTKLVLDPFAHHCIESAASLASNTSMQSSSSLAAERLTYKTAAFEPKVTRSEFRMSQQP